MKNDDYFDNPKSDDDFIKIAIDIYGNEIRDNLIKNIIEIGKKYHLGDE